MDRRQYRKLTCAVALAVGFAALPGFSYAAEQMASQTDQPATAQPTDAKPAAAQPTAAQPANAQPATQSTADAQARETPAAAGTQSAAADQVTKQAEGQQDARTQAWVKSRPAEDIITKAMKQYEGKTIVDTTFDGTTELTAKMAKSTLTMHTGDMFTTSGLQKDREAIFATGYFYDLYPTVEQVPEGIVLTYHVLENPVLKSVKIEGNTVEKTADLEPLITVKPGEILNSRTLHENVQAIQKLYRKDGYILAKITDLNIDKDGNLTVRINEGKLEGFKVKGNTKTKDYVILREMRQKVGEPFNSTKARRSMQRVYNLGFFEDVNIKMNPGVNPNAVIMEIDVKEKRTGSFGIGAGYSSEDGVIGMLSVSDTNFRGTGDAVSVSYEVSGDDSDAHGYTFSWRHPYIDAKETVGTLKIYNRTYEYSDYDEDGNLKEEFMRKYSGGEVTFGRPVSEYSTNYVTLRNRKDEYDNFDESDESTRYSTQEGEYYTDSEGYVHILGRSGPRWAQWRKDNFGLTRSVILEHVTDNRDNIYNPTTGGRVSLTGEFAGLGGDFDYQKFDIEDQRYFKVGHAQVIALRGQLGGSHGHISEYSRFRIGGQSSLRGYRDEQFRGTRMFLATAEYRFPIVSKVQGAIFTDWGSAWSDDWQPDADLIHGSVGVGISLNTPVGPLRLDYGRGDQGGRVHFTVGGTF